jgi:hypothetical protein
MLICVIDERQGGNMNIKFKRFKTIISSILAFVLLCSFMPLNLNKKSLPVQANAASSEEISGYYYNQISEDAKKFYKAIYEMEKNGGLKTGKANFDLIGYEVLTEEQLNGSDDGKEILDAFGEGRDAFKLDHPEIFYVNFDNFTISMGKESGSWYATLGIGRTYNYFADGFNASNVEDAISNFNAKVETIVSAANEKSDNVDKIKYINSYLIENVKYTYVLDNGDEAPNVHNAYGAIVNGTAVCEGYSHAFKVIMDKLGITCILVSGYADNKISSGSGFQGHMWNYVSLNESVWYAVDVTWNDGDNTGLSPEGYLLRGSDYMDDDHETYGVVSNAGHVFEYPTLNTFDYGKTASGINIEEGEESNTKYFYVNYEGKGSEKLEKEEKLYLAIRGYQQSDDNSGFKWYGWAYLSSDSYICTDTQTSVVASSNFKLVQFAVISKAPQDSELKIYADDEVTENDIVCLGEVYNNKNFNIASSATVPYMKSKTPGADEQLDVNKTYDITIEYDEVLHKLDESKEVGVYVVSKHADIADYVKITNVNWDGTSTVTFTFAPSKMYQHRSDTYTFYLSNLVGPKNGDAEGAEPAGTSFLTKNTTVVCDKVFSDERLYISAYGQPTLVGTSDLSLDGWTTEDGNKVLSNQRSQMVLVASTPSTSQSESMENAVAGALGSNDAVKKCETFELEIDICSKYTKIPEGSFVQLAFGFPAGYGPENEGTTFKVYHFKTNSEGSIDYDNPEELDCVITEYGLIVTVTSFSPFAVVAVDSSKVTTTSKAVYASTSGAGGTITQKGISKFDEASTIVYNFEPTWGYKIDKVLVNGEDVTQNVTDNSLTLDYSNLSDNNTLEVTFTTAYDNEEDIPPMPENSVSSSETTPVEPTSTTGELFAILLVFAVAIVALFVGLKFVKTKKKDA